MKILTICGSLRTGSYNSALLRAAQQYFPAGVTTQVANIRDIPLYNQDQDGPDRPEPVQRFITAIEAADALLIASPEYNHSIPGGLKNAIDWASRPAFESPLKNKPTAVIIATGSASKGEYAYTAFQQVFSSTLTPLYDDARFAIGSAYKAFTEDLLLLGKDEDRLQRFIEGFVDWLHN